MKIEFRKSFNKSLKRLSPQDKNLTFNACQKLLSILKRQEEDSKGLGLKKLEKTFWEIRVNIKIRIIFEWQDDFLKFLLAGSHDEIKKFLKKMSNC